MHSVIAPQRQLVFSTSNPSFYTAQNLNDQVSINRKNYSKERSWCRCCLIFRIKAEKEQQREEEERRMERARQREESRRELAERERLILERLRLEEEEQEEEKRRARVKKSKETTRLSC